MKRPFAILMLSACMALAAHAQGVAEWQADVARWQSADWDCGRGETLRLAPSFVSGRSALDLSGIGEASFHWQTNGMGHLYWQAPARIDTGSRPHRLVADFEPWMDCGAAKYDYFFRAGATNGPVQYRAHGTIRMHGSPGAAPNALPLPVQVLDFAKIAWTNAPWGEGGGIVEETDPVFTAWRDADLYDILDSKLDAESPDASTSVTVSGNDGNPYFAIDDGGHVPALTLFKDYMLRFDNSDPQSPAGGYEYWFPPASGTVALDSDLAPYATRSWTLSTYGGTNAWMAIDGPLLGIYSCTNAASGTNTLWESSSAMGGQLANVAQRATNNTARITAIEARPDLTSWGDYAPDGTPNPDAEAMVYLNKALTLMGSGFSWATSGSYACLCQSGAVAFQVENAGEIRIGTDVTTNYFGLVQGGSVTVGCRTDGIRVADGVAYLTYAYAGGAFPVVWFCGDLVEGVWQETTPVWTDNGDGTATAAVPATGSRGFWKATSTRETGAYFRSNVPAHFPAGVYGALASEPVKYDSVITVTSGGHTYRIPAELVQ